MTYEPDAVSVEAMFEAIRALGYRPSLADSAVPQLPAASHAEAGELAAPIVQAVTKAAAAGKHVLLDFRAEWCGACRTMERTTFTDPGVVRLLQRSFVVLAVDTDEHPDIAKQFGIIGLPTLVALDGDGQIVFRHTGPIEPQPLIEVLRALSNG